LSVWQAWKAMRRTRTDQAPSTGPKRLVQMKIGGHPIDLMVDMGTEHSVVTQPVGSLSKRHKTIIRATGDQIHHPFLWSR
jgi:hypothetical protein